MNQTRARRALLGFAAATLLCPVAGCAGSHADPPTAAESPDQHAARILDLARDLETQGDLKKAYAAYHQIIRNFPSTAAATRAAALVQQAQSRARREANRRKRPPR